jgi:REP element-mobilizing transposase RayT
LTEGLLLPILRIVERYRIHADATLYYCTFSVVDWLPVFVSQRPCQVITESLTFCHQHKQLGVDSFVIMPTHLHLVVFDREWDSSRLQQTLTDFRKFTGRQLARLCHETMPSCFSAALAAAAGDDREHRFWQPTRHPEFIESEKFHNQKRDYLHDNPRRKGLVLSPSHWRWSSARWYETGEDCAVPITPVMW